MSAKENKTADLSRRDLIRRVNRALLPQHIFIFGVFIAYIAALAVYIYARGNDIFDPLVSMTRIGWRPETHGAFGWIFLVLFVLLTGPFIFYQVRFYLKNREASGHPQGRFGKLLLVLTVMGMLFLAVGASIPYRPNNDPNNLKDFIHALHNGFSLGGSLIGVLVVTLALIGFCCSTRRQTVIFSVYIILCVAGCFLYDKLLHSTWFLVVAIAAFVAATAALVFSFRKTRTQLIIVGYAVFVIGVYVIYGRLQNAAAFEVGVALCIFIVMYVLNRIAVTAALKAGDSAEPTSAPPPAALGASITPKTRTKSVKNKKTS